MPSKVTMRWGISYEVMQDPDDVNRLLGEAVDGELAKLDEMPGEGRTIIEMHPADVAAVEELK